MASSWWMLCLFLWTIRCHSQRSSMLDVLDAVVVAARRFRLGHADPNRPAWTHIRLHQPNAHQARLGQRCHPLTDGIQCAVRFDEIGSAFGAHRHANETLVLLQCAANARYASMPAMHVEATTDLSTAPAVPG